MIILIPLICFAAFCLLWPVVSEDPTEPVDRIRMQRELREIAGSEKLADSIKCYLRAESRADDQALWEEQLGLLIEYRRTNMSPEKLVRIWLYNRKHAEAIRSWRRCPIIPSTA